MLKEIFHDSFENFEIYKDLYGKLSKHDSVVKVVFFHANVSNFLQPLQSLWRYTAENSQVTYQILIFFFSLC